MTERPPRYSVRKVYGSWYTFRVTYVYGGPSHHVIGKWSTWEAALHAALFWARVGA